MELEKFLKRRFVFGPLVFGSEAVNEVCQKETFGWVKKISSVLIKCVEHTFITTVSFMKSPRYLNLPHIVSCTLKNVILLTKTSVMS